MPHENELNQPERQLAAALGRLKPAENRAVRDRLMFRAGQASARKSQLVWPVISGVLAILLGITWSWPLMHPMQSVSQPVLAKSQAPVLPQTVPWASAGFAATKPQFPFPSNSYLKLRGQMLGNDFENATLAQSGYASGAQLRWEPWQMAPVKIDTKL